MVTQNVKRLEQVLSRAFKELNRSYLLGIDEKSLYNGEAKAQFIEEMEKSITKLKDNGHSSLAAEPSECKFCYQNASALSFHHPETGKFIIQYVIHQKEEYMFCIEECKNKIFPEQDNGLPF